MLGAVIVLGVHSTFFGPIKYAILPQHLEEDDVLGGTGLVEAGTYLAILLGTILAGVVYRSTLLVVIATLVVALLGWLTARADAARAAARAAAGARLEPVRVVVAADLGDDAHPAAVPGDLSRSASSGRSARC